jgi:hypothetical protein
MDKLHFYFFHDVFLNFHQSLMFQYHIASNYYISLLWGVLTELQVVVACFSAPPKFFSGSATGSSAKDDGCDLPLPSPLVHTFVWAHSK